MLFRSIILTLLMTPKPFFFYQSNVFIGLIVYLRNEHLHYEFVTLRLH